MHTYIQYIHSSLLMPHGENANVKLFFTRFQHSKIKKRPSYRRFYLVISHNVTGNDRSEVYSEPSQTSTMELFVKVANG